jgi:hypothetical protein
MSAVMLGARRLHVMRRRVPPEEIVEHAAEQADVDADRSAVQAAAVVAHFGFGAGAGALFGVVARGGRAAKVVEGVAFGLGVWTVSYRGWIPRAGLLAHASEDEPNRQATMIAAHVVYGAVLGALVGSRSDDARHR